MPNKIQMKKLTRSQLAAIFLYSICLIILVTTNPQNLPVAVLLAPLALLFLALLLTVRWAVFKVGDSRNSKLSKKRLNSLAVMVAGFPFLCILLQSIGQFSVRDLAMLVVFFGVLWFYLARTQTIS